MHDPLTDDQSTDDHNVDDHGSDDHDARDHDARDHVSDDHATAVMRAAMPFAATLGVEVLHSSPDEVRSRLAWRESLTTAGGLLHGGALMALADANGGLCAFLNLPEGAGTSTIESKTNFLRAVRGGYATAVSRPLHVGRRVIVVETDILDDTGRLAAKVTQSQAVLEPRSS